MGDLRLVNVDGLELVEPRPGATQSEFLRAFHQAQLGINVGLLLLSAECMPKIMRRKSVRLPEL